MKTLITNIGQLVTPQGRSALCGRQMSEVLILTHTSLTIVDRQIASVGGAKDESEPDVVVDAEGGLVLPGLIDPHRHLTLPPERSDGGSPDGDAAETTKDDRQLPPLPTERALRRGVSMGTVGMEVKCSDDEGNAISSLAHVQESADASPVRVWGTLLGWKQHGDSRDRTDRISALIGSIIPSAKRRRLAAFCDAACGAGGYSAREAETILRAGRGAGFRPKVHAMRDATREAAALAIAVGATSVDHVSEVPFRSASAMRSRGVVSVLLPALSFLDGVPYPNARGLIDQELPIALGTDFGAARDGVESLWVIVSLAVRNLGLSLTEAITAVTLNAAAALDAADDGGSIEPGKRADLLILDIGDYRDLECCIGANPVRTTFVAGEPISLS